MAYYHITSISFASDLIIGSYAAALEVCLALYEEGHADLGEVLVISLDGKVILAAVTADLVFEEDGAMTLAGLVVDKVS